MEHHGRKRIDGPPYDEANICFQATEITRSEHSLQESTMPGVGTYYPWINLSFLLSQPESQTSRKEYWTYEHWAPIVCTIIAAMAHRFCRKDWFEKFFFRKEV